MLSFNIIGAGRLGQTLGKLLHDKGIITLRSLCNQSLGSAQASVDFMRAGNPVARLDELLPADITLLSVPDGKIEETAHAWSQTSSLKPGNILFHASGALPSGLLKSAQEKGVFIASIHPLKSFADPQQAYQTFAGTFCAVEGDEEALAVLCPLFESLGGEIHPISPQNKILYHAACVMACGGLTGLYAICDELFQKAGIHPKQVQALLSPLMKSTLDHNIQLGSAKALTGPVTRGDTATIASHEAALTNEALELYKALTQAQMRTSLRA